MKRMTIKIVVVLVLMIIIAGCDCEIELEANPKINWDKVCFKCHLVCVVPENINSCVSCHSMFYHPGYNDIFSPEALEAPALNK